MGDNPIKDSMNVRDKIGHVSKAFTLSFHYLLRYQRGNDEFKKNIYTFAMREIIQNGGDTDTNACIVGGILGALIGIKQIPKEYVDKSLTFDCTKDFTEDDEFGQPRPEFLSLKKVNFDKIGQLIQCMPDTYADIR